jgi:hypothetical protein
MSHSDLKNTIDLIKNINGLQLNYSNQNLSFKNYSKNSKFITFTNQGGIDVNVPLDDLNNQYKKKYTISNANSVDTSIFNSKNKKLVGGNEDFSATSASFASKINNSFLQSGNISQTSDDIIQVNKEDFNNSILKGGKNDTISQTSDNNMSKINKEDINNSLTSDSSIYDSAKKNNSILKGGKNDTISQTSDNNMSKINKDDINNSLTSESSLKSNTSSFLVGGKNNNNTEYSMTSLDEASAFETESISSINNTENNLKGGYDAYFTNDMKAKNEYDEILTSDTDNINKTFISLNLNDLKNDTLNSDTIKYDNSTLNSLSEFNNLSIKASETGALNILTRQSGGGNNTNNTTFTKSYNINSSSTSSICE